MSTEKIEGLDEVDAAAKAASQVANRVPAIERERSGARTHEAHLAVSAAAAIRRSKDKRAELDEEQEQLDDIDRMAKAFLKSVDDTPAPPATDDTGSGTTPPPAQVQPSQTPPVAPVLPAGLPPAPAPVVPPASASANNNQPNRIYTLAELRLMLNEQLQRLVADRCNIHTVVTDDNRLRIIYVILDAQPGRHQFPLYPRSNRANPSNWGWLQWLLAVVLLLAAYNSGVWIYDGLHPHGFGKSLVWLACKIVIPAIGFFAGGCIGSLIQESLGNHRTGNHQTTA